MVDLTYIGKELDKKVRAKYFTKEQIMELIGKVKKFEEKDLYIGKKIPTIVINRGLEQKQVDRQETVELMLKMIEIIYSEGQPKNFE